jgi:hypothetical protein
LTTLSGQLLQLLRLLRLLRLLKIVAVLTSTSAGSARSDTNESAVARANVNQSKFQHILSQLDNV